VCNPNQLLDLTALSVNLVKTSKNFDALNLIENIQFYSSGDSGTLRKFTETQMHHTIVLQCQPRLASGWGSLFHNMLPNLDECSIWQHQATFEESAYLIYFQHGVEIPVNI
jgi:hypothetical protein